MKRDFLESLGLDKETIDKVMSEHGKSLTAEKQKVTELEVERDSFKEQLSQRDSDIETLKKDSGTSEELKQQLEKWQGDYDTLKADSEVQLAETKKNAAIDLALTKSGAKNIKAAKALLDLDGLEVTEKGVNGLDEQLKALQENESYLFGESEKATPPQIVTGGNPGQTVVKEGPLGQQMKSEKFNLTKFLTDKGENK